jgi:hypothetical protein
MEIWILKISYDIVCHSIPQYTKGSWQVAQITHPQFSVINLTCDDVVQLRTCGLITMNASYTTLTLNFTDENWKLRFTCEFPGDRKSASNIRMQLI